MSFSTFGLSAATVGMATLAFAIAAPASAQEHYAQKHYAQTHYTHYAHTHYAHARYRHYARYGEGRQIIVHPQPPVQAHYGFGPAVVVGDVVGGTGQAVQAVFNGAGAIVGGILGGVFGGASAIFGYPHYAAATPAYAYGYGGPSYNYAAYGARSRRRSMRPAQSPQHPSSWSAALWKGRRPRATQPLPAMPTRRQRARPRTATRALRRLSLDGQSMRSRRRQLRLLSATNQPMTDRIEFITSEWPMTDRSRRRGQEPSRSSRNNRSLAVVDRSLPAGPGEGRDALGTDPYRATPLLRLCATLSPSTRVCAGSRPTQRQ